jgi:biotin carboxyl carrier protein
MSQADRAFAITLDGVEYQIEMHGNTVLVNGHPFVVGFEGEGVTVDGTRYEVELQGDTASVNGIAHTVTVAGLQVTRAKPPASAGPAKVADAAQGAGVIKAIMPGKVIRVLVSEGDEIQEGAVAVILEAMKMENELRSDRSGLVKQVAVSPGDDVELGHVLVVIE